MDYSDIVTSVAFTTRLAPGDDYTQAVTEINGKIKRMTFRADDYEVEYHTIGKFRLYRIDLGLLEPGTDLALVMDDHSGELAQLTPYLDCVSIHDAVLLVDRMELLPRYRRYGIGRVVLAEQLRLFAPLAGPVFLEAFPLQHETKGAPAASLHPKWHKAMHYERMQGNLEQQQARLVTHYESCGFVHLAGGMMVYVRNPHLLHPPEISRVRAELAGEDAVTITEADLEQVRNIMDRALSLPDDDRELPDDDDWPDGLFDDEGCEDEPPRRA